MRTAQRGLHSNPVDIDASSHQGLVELARCRSDPSTGSGQALSFHLLAWCLLRGGFVARYAAVAAGAIGIVVAALGLTLTCRGSKAWPLVITAHKMRAFLLASATAAFCQPARSRKAVTHKQIGSLRLCASGLFESGLGLRVADVRTACFAALST